MDYKELYEDLTKKLEGVIPFMAYPTRELVQVFRNNKTPVTLNSKLTITSVINSGDVSGILCAVKDNGENVIACSLNHLIPPPGCPFYKEIIAYQHKRQKRINQLNQRGY